MKTQIQTNYCSLSDLQLTQLAFIVSHSIVDNYFFSGRVPLLDTLINQQLAFNLIIKKAARNNEALFEKEILRSQLLFTLQNLALYINKVFAGKKAILLTSGFPLADEVAFTSPFHYKQQGIMLQNKNSMNV